jgi:hypothetical protein
MVKSPERSRVYILYQHSLFAEGIRSLLRHQPTITIVGAEKDKTQALKEVKALKPAVILVEEAAGEPLRSAALDFVHGRAAARVISLNLDHSAATVYDRGSVRMSTPVDLLHAVRGCPRVATPDEPIPRPGRGSRERSASKANAAMPKAKTIPRKGRA